MRHAAKLLLTLTITLSLIACGSGGGESASSAQPVDNEAPHIELASQRTPYTTTSPEVLVQIRATDDVSGVAQVHINRLPAEYDPSIQLWHASLPVNGTLSDVEVTALDQAGNSTLKHYALNIASSPYAVMQTNLMAANFEARSLYLIDSKLGHAFTSNIDNPRLALLAWTEASHQTLKLLTGPTSDGKLVGVFNNETRPASFRLAQIEPETGSETLLIDNLGDISAITVNTQNRRIYYFSKPFGSRTGVSLKAFDMQTQTTLDISDVQSGGPAMSQPMGLFTDDSHAYYIEPDRDHVIRANLATGARNILSPPAHGNHLALNKAQSIAGDATLGRLWVATLDSIIEVDISSGERQLLWQKQQASKDAPTPGKLLVDIEHARLIVSDQKTGVVNSLNLATQQLSPLIEARYGHGPAVQRPISLVAGTEELFVADGNSKLIFGIRQENGNRRIISQLRDASLGHVISEPNNMTFDHLRNRILVNDQRHNNIVELDPLNGTRQLHSTLGMADDLIRLPIAMHASGQNIYIADAFHDLIFRATPSEPTPQTYVPKHVSLKLGLAKVVSLTSIDTRQLLVGLDKVSKSVFVVDMQTADAATVASNQLGSGINFINPVAVTEFDDTTAVVADAGLNALIKVDLESGEREVFSNAVKGSGPNFEALTGVVYPSGSREFFASDASLGAIFAVDITTGNRRILSR